MSELKVPPNTEPQNLSPANPKKNIFGKFFGDDGFNFKDILDLINPLHHIPIVGSIYRAISKDKIAPAIKLAGGALFGGPAGASLAAVGLMASKNKMSEVDKTAIFANQRNIRSISPDSNMINIDDLIAQRRITYLGRSNGNSFPFSSNIPSVNNYNLFVSFHKEKMIGEALRANSKRLGGVAELEELNNSSSKERLIDKRL